MLIFLALIAVLIVVIAYRRYRVWSSVSPRPPVRSERVISQSQNNLSRSPVKPENEQALSSKVPSDYAQLSNLLAAQRWKEADDETARIMLNISGREKEGWLDQQSIAKFPCTALNTIDLLWMQYSQGRFGFTPQKNIWLECGAQVTYETECRLGNRVGWFTDSSGWLCVSKENQIFNLTAPPGHLPLLFLAKTGILLRWMGRVEAMQSALAARFLTCSSTELQDQQSLQQKNIQAKYEQGLNLLNSRQYAAALDVFNALNQSIPEFAEAFHCKGLALGNLGRHEESLAAFEAALRLNPTFDEVYRNRDSALYNLGRIEEALESYNTLLASNPDYAYGHYLKGVLLDGLGYHEAALEALHRAIQLQPNFAPFHLSQGIVLDHLGRSAEALQAINESLKLDPSSIQAQNSWRIVKQKLGGVV